MMNLASYLVSGIATVASTPEGFLTETVISDSFETSNSAPGSKFDLNSWYIQLPYSSSGSYTSGDASSVKQPELNTFSKDNIFWLDSNGLMVMKTPVKGVTTGGSDHPRTELREVYGSNHHWDCNDGKTHTMEVSATVTHVAAVTARVVTMQVFDEVDSHMWEVFASKDKGLYGYHFSPDGSHVTKTIDSNWSSGHEYTLKTVIHNGHMDVYYNGSLNQSFSVQGKQLYFKTGDYCQSDQSVDPSTDYCEVKISKLIVSHK
jgi:hypothetical protein